LSVGAYRDDQGKPWILPVVKKAETQLAKDIEEEKINHEYLPVLGYGTYSEAAVQLILGSDSYAVNNGLSFGIQCLSGTGALRVGAEFLKQQLHSSVVLLSDPTWGNHNLIFKLAGFADIRKYRYWGKENRNLNFAGMMEDLKAAPERAVVILHGCAHNPTGIDPTKAQWEEIANVVEEKKLIPFFDCAYQGFASGDLDADAWAVRYFVNERKMEIFCSQSFSKNFGLYNERAGNLTVVVKNPSVVANTKSQLTLVVRGMYSNPPAHGARVVEKVLNSDSLFAEWKNNIKTMAGRIIAMRKELRDKLESLGTPGSWNHITDQIGMFSFTGLSPEMCEFLLKEKHIYLLKNGRISMCGVTPGNLDYLANSINEAVNKFQSRL
jgi:aspartate aminotransferase